MAMNFKKVGVQEGARIELHDTLGLTGAEISINVLPAGASVPFVHAHRQNEEIYGTSRGRARPRSTAKRFCFPPAIGCAYLPLRSVGSLRGKIARSSIFAFR